MAEDVTLFELQGTPYFISESKNKMWYPVRCILEPDKPDPNKTSWTYKFDTDHPLMLGLDMKEIPTRNLSLLVRALSNDHAIKAIIYDLKKLAEIAGCDYYSLESIAGYGCCTISKEGGYDLVEARPRLFRKIVNN